MVMRDADVPQDSRIEFCVGINGGDIIIDEGDIHGDRVNVAARLEGLPNPDISAFLKRTIRYRKWRRTE